MKNLLESLQHYQLQNCKKPSTRRKLKVQISLAGNNVVRAPRESVLQCFEDEMKGKSEIARAERLGEHLTPLACLNVKGTELRFRCRFRTNSVDLGPVWINSLFKRFLHKTKITIQFLTINLKDQKQENACIWEWE
jgi:hypothetical protein